MYFWYILGGGERIRVESWMFLMKIPNNDIELYILIKKKNICFIFALYPVHIRIAMFSPKACKSYAEKRMHDKFVPLRQAILLVRIWYIA